MKKVPVESLVIDGESDESGQMGACDGHIGFHPPYALFSPDLQENVGGPYATYGHAEAALQLIVAGKMVPYTDKAGIVWTVGGKVSSWYDKP